ncbi:hypothetical protein FQN57_002046 [Myotisia sp. PD_48]|nr:hypothetical protein FQN57_002046 [Myotisia sp. PD_48]
MDQFPFPEIDPIIVPWLTPLPSDFSAVGLGMDQVDHQLTDLENSAPIPGAEDKIGDFAQAIPAIPQIPELDTEHQELQNLSNAAQIPVPASDTIDMIFQDTATSAAELPLSDDEMRNMLQYLARDPIQDKPQEGQDLSQTTAENEEMGAYHSSINPSQQETFTNEVEYVQDDDEYQKAKAEFELQTNPTIESRMLFERAQKKEDRRRARAILQAEFENIQTDDGQPTTDQVVTNEASLFFSDSEAGPDSAASPEGQSTAYSQDVKTGNNDDLAQVSNSTPKPKRKYTRKPKGKTSSHITKSKGRKRAKKTKARTLNFDSIFSSTLHYANENALKPKIPRPAAKNKQEAIREMIACIPLENRDGIDISGDKKRIMEAVVKFTRPPKADGDGGWRHDDMKTSLFHYQLIGVGFMRDRESSVAHPKGGLLCDEMGFGKTLQAIANMVDGRAPPSHRANEPVTTLIVAPAHLVPHWKEQLYQHVKPNVLGQIVIHCAQEKSDLVYIMRTGLNQVGVIITTYSTVRTSCKFPIPSIPDKAELFAWKQKHCGPLHQIKFRRIILDEAHEIKNHESKTSLAVRALNGRYRWVISGTPIHNSVAELYPLFDFLQVPYFSSYGTFLHKLVTSDPGHGRLKNTLRAWMIRRTHQDSLLGFPILTLPEFNVKTIVTKFSQVERFIYKQMTETFLQDEIPGMACGPQNWLVLLGKCRMFTSHILLVQQLLRKTLTPGVMGDLQKIVTKAPTPTDIQTLSVLQKLLAKEPVTASPTQTYSKKPMQESQAPQDLIARFKIAINTPNADITLTQCSNCSVEPLAAYILPCLHLICPGCIFELSQHRCEYGLVGTPTFCGDINSLLKIQNRNFSRQDGFEENISTDDGEEEVNWASAAGVLVPGAKLEAVRNCIYEWLTESPTTKITIFTQFLGMMHILCAMCDTEGWDFLTLSGKHKASERNERVEEFSRNPEIRIMISSLRSGGTGINLTAARKCILVDLWWNEAIERQAFCRLFRIGQTSNVEMVRVTVEDTVDDRVQGIQKAKTESIERVMGSQVLAERDTLPEILRIFGFVEDPNTINGIRFEDDTEEERA